MSATLYICERNGSAPGNVTENISVINWKATDNSNSVYLQAGDPVNAGTNSYEKYNYLKFVGNFTSIGNIQITRVSDNLPYGVKLYSSRTASVSTDCFPYSTPVRTQSTKATVDISNNGSVVGLLVGPQKGNVDPAAPGLKSAVGYKLANTALYSNYLVTQLQTTQSAVTNDLTGISLSISYDET